MNPVFWSKLRILLLSSNHEGKSCYLRLIRVQRRAQGAQQIKVNSVGLKGRNNWITNCFPRQLFSVSLLLESGQSLTHQNKESLGASASRSCLSDAFATKTNGKATQASDPPTACQGQRAQERGTEILKPHAPHKAACRAVRDMLALSASSLWLMSAVRIG